MPPALAPGALGAALPGAAAAAGAGGALGPASATPDMAMKNIAEAVEALQLEMAKASSVKEKERKKNSSSSKSKKDKKKKVKKKKKRGDSSDSSSRSRSGSSSSEGSDSDDGPLRWKRRAKNRKVASGALMHIETMKFKKRGDLIAYSTKYPGALSAHFLAGIYSKIHKGVLGHSRQLREVNVAAWASAHTGLTETRDLREVSNIAAAMDAIQKDEVAVALDILAQRVISIQNAKKPGGKWEKSEQVELICPSGAGLASAGMLSLMGSQ